MFHTPGRTRPTAGVTPYKGGGNNNGNVIPEGPICELMALIEETSADDWQRRVVAWENLVRHIPDGSAYLQGPAWFNTPKSICHLTHPLSELLRDPRSSVVRRVCTALLELFHKCQSDARLLFKELMPTILTVQAQTVQIIRTAVTALVTEAIPQVPCKSVMPFWMDRLRDKSPAVRDACSLYLGLALQHWDTSNTNNNNSTHSAEEGAGYNNSTNNNNYLTDEIWMQVGAALLKTMRDPSPTVRQHAKSALELMRLQHPHKWEALIIDPNGPAARDAKLQQWLRSLGSHSHTNNYNNNSNNHYNTSDDLSVASKYTYNSESRFAAKPPGSNTNGMRISSPRSMLRFNHSTDDDSGPPRYARSNHTGNNNTVVLTNNLNAVPFTIAVTTATTTASAETTASNNNKGGGLSAIGGLGPPLRLLNPKQQQPQQPAAPFSHVVHTPPPPPPTAATTSVRNTPPRPPSAAASGMTIGKNAYSSPQAQTYTELAKNASEEEEEADRLEYSESSNHSNRDWRQTNNNTNNTIKYSRTEESPFITSMHELKKHASRRRSRNSILMQERFRSSSSITNVTAARSFTADATASIPEHKPAAGDKHEHPATILEESSSSEIENKIPNGHVATNATPISSSPLTRTAATPPETSLSTSSMSAPEHIVIAIRLLRAHKAHVDQIMETLKLEMDTLRDFDRLLEEPGRPSEEELVNYYEAVDLCLEQRLSAGLDLRREMNRISAGDSAVAE